MLSPEERAVTVYLGADWSAADLKTAVAIGDGPPRRFKGVKRDYESVKAVVDAARARGGEGAEVRVAIEAGAPGWVELLHHAGAVVFVVDPKQAKSFAASMCSSGAKDDVRDAVALTEMVRSPRHTQSPWAPATDEQAVIELLATAHEQAQKLLTAAIQRVRAMLREVFPTLEAALGAIDTAWAVRLLRAAPTPWHAANLGEAALTEAMSGAREGGRKAVREAFAKGASPGWSKERAAGVATTLGLLLDQMVFQQEQLARVERELTDRTATYSVRTLAETMGGIKTKMALRLVEGGVPSAPANRDEISVLMGSSPVFVGSGTTRKGDPRGHAQMRRAVPARSRATTYLVGRLAAQEMRWAKAMYADARARGQNAAHAYRRIARCVYRILSAMLTTGEAYDEVRYIAGLKARGVPWAEKLEVAAS